MGSPLPKINPLHALGRRVQLKAQYRVLRPDVRHDTWIRDGRRCRACERQVALHSDDPWAVANIHERTGGSQRAVEAIDVTLVSTITLCKACHDQIKPHKLHLDVLDPDAGFNGPVHVTGLLGTGERLTTPFLSTATVDPVDARKP